MKIPKLFLLIGPLLFFAYLFMPICAHSQSTLDARESLYDELEGIGMFRKKVLSFEFKEGEEIFLNIEVIGGRKLGRFSIDQPGTPLDLVKKKMRIIERQSIDVKRDGDFTFTFKNRSIFKRNVRIRIDKYPRKRTRDTMILDDIIVSTSIDTVRDAYADTTGLPDVTMHSFVLQPSLNYKTASDACFVEALLEDDYQFAVYWIGVGDRAKRAYDKLKNNPPPSWQMQGVNEPLFAYATGLTERLPTSTSSLLTNLRFAFKDPNGNDRDLSRSDKNPPLYGVIPVYKAGRYKKVRMCFRNFNTTTKVPVYIFLAKYKLEKKDKLEIIKRERVQEIFIKKPLTVYED